MIWKMLFSALGLGSFLLILHGYGIAKVASDLAGLGLWTLPLALSFLPTVFFYSLAWLLITPELGRRHLGALHRLTIISVAWNNLSPFVKVLGEPVRVKLLERWLDPKAAAKSMVLYNIVHALGTLISIFLGALILLLFFPVASAIRVAFLAVLLVVPLLIVGLYTLPHIARRFGRSAKRNRLVLAGFWVRWGFSKIRIFSRRYPLRFWLAVLAEVAARFIEGLTFYVAFLALHQAVPLLVCMLLDVGRALIDNLFFFIPYQVGSREGGILLLAKLAAKIPPEPAVSAALFYRLVEIFWMGAGYLFWIAEARSRRLSTK